MNDRSLHSEPWVLWHGTPLIRWTIPVRNCRSNRISRTDTYYGSTIMILRWRRREWEVEKGGIAFHLVRWRGRIAMQLSAPCSACQFHHVFVALSCFSRFIDTNPFPGRLNPKRCSNSQRVNTNNSRDNATVYKLKIVVRFTIFQIIYEFEPHSHIDFISAYTKCLTN